MITKSMTLNTFRLYKVDQSNKTQLKNAADTDGGMYDVIVDGVTLGFTHGFNIHFKTITPPANVNVVMVAPKGPGHTVRFEYEKGGGVPCLLAIHQDATSASGGDKAFDIAMAWAIGMSHGPRQTGKR